MSICIVSFSNFFGNNLIWFRIVFGYLRGGTTFHFIDIRIYIQNWFIDSFEVDVMSSLHPKIFLVEFLSVVIHLEFSITKSISRLLFFGSKYTINHLICVNKVSCRFWIWFNLRCCSTHINFTICFSCGIYDRTIVPLFSCLFDCFEFCFHPWSLKFFIPKYCWCCWNLGKILKYII